MAWAHTRASVWRGRRAVEGALMVAAVVGLSVIALSADQPLTYIVFPAFIWAALRLGPPGATLAVAVAAVIAVLATSNKAGPFVEHSPTDSALSLQLYIVFAALTTFCLAAIVSERRRAALELAESQRREGERAALERQRIARDLHDSVSQSLFSTTLHVRTAQHALELEKLDSTGPVGKELNEIGQLTRGALAEMRALIFELRPGALAEEGLVAALAKQASALSAREGLVIEVDGPDGPLPIGPEVEEQLYRVGQEALANVVKHARRAPPRSSSQRRTARSRSRSPTTAAASIQPRWLPNTSACSRCEAEWPISGAASRSRARLAAAPSSASRYRRDSDGTGSRSAPGVVVVVDVGLLEVFPVDVRVGVVAVLHAGVVVLVLVTGQLVLEGVAVP
jgi:signal transduction histidine kinase